MNDAATLRVVAIEEARCEVHARFDASVAKTDGCWVWTGGLDDDGYGYLYIERFRWKAHRLAWMLFNGPIPEGVHVLHRCDNPPCVRPDHLFLGTQADNLADMRAKGRARRGQVVPPLAAARRAMTRCQRGHEFTPENTKRHRTSGRICRTCYNAWRQANRESLNSRRRKLVRKEMG